MVPLTARKCPFGRKDCAYYIGALDVCTKRFCNDRTPSGVQECFCPRSDAFLVPKAVLELLEEQECRFEADDCAYHCVQGKCRKRFYPGNSPETLSDCFKPGHLGGVELAD